MATLLSQWLRDEAGLDVEANNFDKDFASGYLFGKLFHACNLQPDFDKFSSKGNADAYLNNYKRLQPTFDQLGIKMDTRTANALLHNESGLAGKLLYSIKQAMSSMNKGFQALDHTGRTVKQFGVRQSPTKGLLESQKFKTQREAFDSQNARFFEDLLRAQGENPNAVMQTMHLKRFLDEGLHQQQAAFQAEQQAHADKAAVQDAFRTTVRSKLATGKLERVKQLEHDEAVHAAIMKRKEDIEKEELRVELALADKTTHKRLEHRDTAAHEVANGIDAFEMTLKRFGGGEDEPAVSGTTAGADGQGGARSGTANGSSGQTPMETLNRIRTFAPTTAKLTEEAGEYLTTITARRKEENLTRKEREARRRQLVVEQQAAREASERKAESDAVLELLARRSAEEQALAARLWQLGRERDAMKANRELREQHYAARKEKDWEDVLRRETELHKSLRQQYVTDTAQELSSWRAAQDERRAAKLAKRSSMCKDIAWQLVMLAERVIEFRSATAAGAVPRKDWRQWMAMFVQGDPALGTPVITDQPQEHPPTTVTLNHAEVHDYLAGAGDWQSDQPPQQNMELGRLVAQLAAAAQQKPDGAQVAKLDMPLRLAVVGAPFSGKSTVAQALAQGSGIKLITPDSVVSEAVAAAEEYERQQQQQQQAATPSHNATSISEDEGSGEPAAPVEEPVQVQLGQQLQRLLQSGEATPDDVLVNLMVLAMQDACNYVPPPPVDDSNTKQKKDQKAAAAAKPPAAIAPPVKPAAAPAPAAPVPTAVKPGGIAAVAATGSTPPGIGMGATAIPAKGRGFILDAFPMTKAQAVLLERKLTGLDLDTESSLITNASRIAPPPDDLLPQLDRPLVSGLDAVVVLECGDEAVAVKRALGRRLDPTTGHVYHLEFDSPPSNVPGLTERLIQIHGDANDAEQVSQRLAAHEAEGSVLQDWLRHFSRLMRPLDGAADLKDVLTAASDIVNGILRAKAAATSANTALAAAKQAKQSADKAHEFAQLAQGHAESAARELLSAKKAEIQATALLNNSKNPDAAATEVLKAQSAAKCAEQLKVCRAAAGDAATYAERASTSAGVASEAVTRARRAIGDAEVSAEAEAAARKAADDAEVASRGAAEAASKAESAKQVAAAFAAEAEKWFATQDVQPDAKVSSVEQLTAALEANNSSASTASTPETSAGLQPSPGDASSAQPLCLPKQLADLLHEEWTTLESGYIHSLGLEFSGLREARSLAFSHIAGCCAAFKAVLKRRDGKQALLSAFLEQFNAVDVDMRRSKETQAELLLRCEELREALWSICDSKMEESEAEKARLSGTAAAAEHVTLMGQYYAQLVQVELDRFLSTAQFLLSSSHHQHGIYAVPERQLCPVPTTVSTGNVPPELKDKVEGKGAQAVTSLVAHIQGKVPQLATAIKLALVVASTTAGNLKPPAVAAMPATAAAAAKSGGKGAEGAGKLSSTGSKSGEKTPGGKGAANTKQQQAAAAAAAAQAAAAQEESCQQPKAAAISPAVYEAAQADFEAGVAKELTSLQQRLLRLANKAAAQIDELITVQAAANSHMSDSLKVRYAAECAAVAALYKLVSSTAVSGDMLPYDLRLEDDKFIIDESQLLLPPPSPAPPAPVQHVPGPPGALSGDQLSVVVAALQEASSGTGYIPVSDTVELMRRLAAQGSLPPAWRSIDAKHMLSAIQQFDEVYSGYIDWYELLVCLVGSAVPAVHNATPQILAKQVLQLAAADSDGDGCLTSEEWEQAQLWWQPTPAAAAVAADGQTLDEQEASHDDQQDQFEVDRCKALRAVLWQAFHHEQVVPTTQEQATSSTVTGDQRQPSGVPITPMSSTAAASQQQAAKASAGQSADLSTCDEDDKAAPASVQVLDYRALLLYLSADRNLFTGIRKAMAVVTGDASPHAHATADQVVRMAYPLLTPDTGQAIHRAPPTAAQIAAAVKAAYDNRGGDATAVPSVTAEQVMYSPACDRVISLLMTRYQAKDVYIAARL